MLNIKDRVHNRFFWVSIFAIIPLAAYTFGFDMNFIPENYKELVLAILNVLVLAGVINNPTTSNKWLGDDVEGRKE